jgi:hypothetical protein
MDGQHASFWIADSPGKIQPGIEVGQSFSTYIFSWEPSSVAGTTVWSNLTFGAQLSLDPINATPAQPFNRNLWLGTWNMDHDGWHGQLKITGFGTATLFGIFLPVIATYQPIGGAPLATSALLWVGAQHHLWMEISFATNNVQPFDLYHHTWEADLFSGTTQWGGMTFGVRGHR